MTHYLYLEIEGIQRFVFASPKLKIIRGGSALLDRFNRLDMRDAVRDQGGEVLLACGGHCLVRGLSLEAAENLGNDLTRKLRKLTDGQVTLSFGVAAEGPWPEVQAAYHADLRTRALKLPPAPPPLPPFVAHCSSCGASPARMLKDMQERQLKPFCQACHLRLGAAQQLLEVTKETIWDRLRPYLGMYGKPGDDQAFRKVLPDREFKDLATLGSGQTYLAYLYCDGNGMGKNLRETASDEDYAKLSKRVDDALHKSVAVAFLKYCPPEQQSAGKFAAEVLLLGGDDLIIAMPADRGADVTLEVLEVFHRETGGTCRLSAGLVFAPQTTPIAILQRVAESLLRSAKRYAYLDDVRDAIGHAVIQSEDDAAPRRPPDVGYIDFQELTSAQIDVERSHAVTCRPYRLDDFRTLVRRAREAKVVPKSRLHALGEAVRGSEREAYTMARLIVGRARTGDKKDVQADALLALLRPFSDPGHPKRAQPYATYPQGGDLPFDLYWGSDPKAHRWSAIPDVLELIDHLDSGEALP